MPCVRVLYCMYTSWETSKYRIVQKTNIEEGRGKTKIVYRCDCFTRLMQRLVRFIRFINGKIDGTHIFLFPVLDSWSSGDELGFGDNVSVKNVSSYHNTFSMHFHA